MLARRIDRDRLKKYCEDLGGNFNERFEICWVENIPEAQTVAKEACIIGNPHFFKKDMGGMPHYGVTCDTNPLEIARKWGLKILESVI